ncbi:MAG: hypothetical protein AAB229_01255 [Candidatus Hydrogenedentota bacterium]
MATPFPAQESADVVPRPVILDASDGTYGRIRNLLCGGLTLEERILRQLRRAGCEEVYVLLDRLDSHDDALLNHGSRPDLLPACIHRVTKIPLADSSICIWFPARTIIHPRLLERLLQPGDPVHVRTSGCFAGAALWSCHDGAQPLGRALEMRELDSYDESTRRDQAVYFHPIRDEKDIARDSEFLLLRTQKDALDLPGRYLHPRFENALVRKLAPSRITPNHITLATTIAAFVVTALYARGFLRIGALGAAALGVLDGVDRKLARLRLETSRLGEMEHVLDFLYENSWYLALAAHFRMRPYGVALVAADLADNMAYLAVKKRTGRMIDELSPGDRAFRAVAGRRNIYNWILLPCFLLGALMARSPAAGFRLAVRWGAITATIHSLRAATARVGSGTARRGEGRPRS